MKILVTGANGQVGYELVQLGPLSGHEIIAAGREELDITNGDAVERFIKTHQPEAIINAAAYTAVDKAEAEKDKAFAVNAQAVANLAEVATELNIPILHISTDYVFDGEKSTAYQESDITNPVNVYGASKREGEIILEKSGINYFILRTSWVFGRKGNNFVKTMMRLAADRDVLTIIDDQYGCPTYAGDIAQTLLSAAPIVARGEKTGIYHYAGDVAVSWFDFAKAILNQALKNKLIKRLPDLSPIPTSDYPTPAQRPKNSVLDSGRAVVDFRVEQSPWCEKVSLVLMEGVT